MLQRETGWAALPGDYRTMATGYDRSHERTAHAPFRARSADYLSPIKRRSSPIILPVARRGGRNSRQPLRLQGHAARDLDALGVNPAIVFGKQRSDHRAYVVGLAGAA
jgi:hypothetical protein